MPLGGQSDTTHRWVYLNNKSAPAGRSFSNAKEQNRTADTAVFSRVLYLLSYLGSKYAYFSEFCDNVKCTVFFVCGIKQSLSVWEIVLFHALTLTEAVQKHSDALLGNRPRLLYSASL